MQDMPNHTSPSTHNSGYKQFLRRNLYRAFSLLGRKHANDFASATKNYKAAQSKLLQNMLAANTESVYGRKYNFKAIKTIEDFKQAVPIVDYTNLEPYVQASMQGQPHVLTSETPIMFATTSGTSANPKYIPVTRQYVREFRQASVVSGYHLFRDYPGIADGIVFSMTSRAVEGLTPSGIPYGAISGLLFKEEPWYIRKFVSPVPYEAYLVEDYESRYYTLARLALQLPLSCLYTLNPSTIKMLVSKLSQYGPKLVADIANGTITPPQKLGKSTTAAVKPFISADTARARQLEKLITTGEFKPSKIWPQLQLISCWTKAAAAFYLEEFPQSFGNLTVEDISYGASEGRGTVYGGAGKQVLALCSHFFEFIPEEEIDSVAPATLLGCDLEVGKNYYILFTTSAGLYRYHINDVVKVLGFENQAPLLEFQYKGGNISSFTGEKITELQVVQAMTSTLQELNMSANFFTVIPQFKPQPHYELWLELPSLPSEDSGHHISRVATVMDEKLKHINIEYKAKRESGRLDSFEAKILVPGTYEKLRKHLCTQHVADAQIKVSHLNPKPEIQGFLEQQLRVSMPASVAAPAGTPA
jgi:peptidoglycan hydrolase-like protein with peptidoglycan-binding domain